MMATNARKKRDKKNDASKAIQNSNRPAMQPYFYGRITREEAEMKLENAGAMEGMYLLRESIRPLGNYAISLCHKNNIHHYPVEKQLDGTYKIPGGLDFTSPVDLIEYYSTHPDMLITCPKIPCNRGPDQSPIVFRGVTYHQLEKAMQIEAKKIKADMKRAMGPLRDTLMKRVAHSLHTDMPWFHGKISRETAQSRIASDGHEEGKFLIRQKDDKSFALTLSSQGVFKHYLISVRSDSSLSIEDGPKFDCLMMLVDNYHNKSDGLLCKLRKPCCRPGGSNNDFDQYVMDLESLEDKVKDHEPLGKKKHRPPPKPPVEENDEDHPTVELDMDGDDLENVYGSVSLRQAVVAKKLERSQVILDDQKLGHGHFGSVMKGVCRVNSKEIHVAVKTLKMTDLEPGVQSDLLAEAEMMKSLNHKHIVRMIGTCEAETVMLVLELAALGPLNKYLKKHKDMPLWNILELMWQVSQGMEYLESSNFVHRDLAARNILLCDEHFAKISDFGMSKTLSQESNYYVASKTGRWPLKWYAPESILYNKFDSKSDVWGFGVTLWEAASYGAKPYHKMAENLTEFIKRGDRLQKPLGCSEDVYDVMLLCWTENRDRRPTFKKLVPMMKALYKDHSALDI